MPWKECHVMDERLRFVARFPIALRETTAYEGNPAAIQPSGLYGLKQYWYPVALYGADIDQR
jgi:hypothetical protein